MIFGRVRGRIRAAMRTKASRKRGGAPAGASGGTATSGSSNVSVSGLPVLSTAEEVVRALECGPDEGLVVLDARALREGVRALLRQGRAGEEASRGQALARSAADAVSAEDLRTYGCMPQPSGWRRSMGAIGALPHLPKESGTRRACRLRW